MLLLFLITFSGFFSTQVSASGYAAHCDQVSRFNGTIEDRHVSSRGYNSYSSSIYYRCWRISVPADHFIRIKFQTINFENEDCVNTYLEITMKNTDEGYYFCRMYEVFTRTTVLYAFTPITALSDVHIRFTAYYTANFELDYEIKHVECSRSDSFHCTSYSCIPKSRVCDEVLDCLNGADEAGCATGINSVEGIAEVRNKSIAWLRNKKSPLKGWRENTVIAITALHLSEKSTFNGGNLEEELMAKQIELETAVALLKGTVSNQLLSMYINALLLTCQDPRHFYGKDLVKLLKDQVEESGNFTHPSAYLALCNAKEEWPHRWTSDIVSVLSSDSEYNFIGDFQAFAVMAVACYNETKFLNRTESADLLSVYQKTIKDFKEHQLPDGSFGNVHATSLITQSLLASGQEHTKDWKLKATVKYLMKELGSSNADFLTYYLTLPILNGKTLTDIANYNCSQTAVDPGGPIQSQCLDLKELSGNITETYPGPRNYRYNKCWNILNPDNNLLEIELKHLDFERKSCSYVYLTITTNRTGERVKWCDNNDERKPIAVHSNVTVHFYVDSLELTPLSRENFEIIYNIDTSTKGIEGVKEAYWQAVTWLKSNSTSWKWINHIPKAVTALSLSEGAKFDGKNLKEELMVKQRELRISIALLRDAISSEHLSTFINSILSTCHNPRNFYGHNLVELLKKQVASENFTHPASYLALCNANETWPDKAYDNLLKIYKSASELPFNRDIQAFAVMALSCKFRQGGYNLIPNDRELLDAYEGIIQEFMRLQNPSGSFGNVQRTALITQALLSSIAINESVEDWDHLKAVRFLIKSMKVPPTDFLSTYLILPLLNDKTLVDISFTNCSGSRDQDDLVAEIHDYLGPKIQVQYSLFIGDSKDVIHTIVLKVPKHFTAFDVMQFAALKDKKYNFKYESVSGKLDIYEVADIPNDPEDGKFWLFYKKNTAAGNTFEHEETGPIKTVLSEGDHIAMWYKKYSMNYQ